MADERFETALARTLVALADEDVRPVDAHSLALDLVRAGRPARVRMLIPTRSNRVWLVFAAAALLLLAILGAAVVGRLVLPHGPLGPLAFIRDGDLWAAAADGTDQRRVADQGGEHFEYLVARWSPDGSYLLVVRDLGDIDLVPALELFDRDGRRLWSRPLEPGGLPDVSWAPDSRRFVVDEFPTIAATTGELLAPYPGDAVSPMSLAIFRVDGSRTSFSMRAAAPPFVRPGDARAIVQSDQWVRWSPTSDSILVKALDGTCCDPRLWIVSASGSDRQRITNAQTGVLPMWFAWQPDGNAIDVLGISRDESCPHGEVVDGVCTSGTWSIEPANGQWTFHPFTGESGTAEPGAAYVTDLAATPDERQVALSWSIVGQPTSEALDHPSRRMEVLETATSTRAVVASGAWTVVGPADQPADVVGDCVLSGFLFWAGDGRHIYHLGVSAGEASTWSIRSVDAAGGSATTIVTSVTTFDLARR